MYLIPKGVNKSIIISLKTLNVLESKSTLLIPYSNISKYCLTKTLTQNYSAEQLLHFLLMYPTSLRLVD